MDLRTFIDIALFLVTGIGGFISTLVKRDVGAFDRQFRDLASSIDKAKLEMAEGVRALRGDVKEMSEKLGGHGEDIAKLTAVQMSHDARLSALEKRGRR